MLKNLTEEDFEALRGPIDSGRQSPKSLSSNLILAIFLQALLFYLTYSVAAASTIYPNIEQVRTVHFWITVGLCILSMIYAIPAVYQRSERFQYFVTILVSQNLFGVYFYLCALFLIGEGTGFTEESLVNFTYMTLMIAIAFFIALFIRLHVLLKKGYYRKGSKNDELRSKFEKKSYLPIAIIGGICFFLIFQSLIRTFHLTDLQMVFLIVIPLLIFYAMIFVLPEQLLILYCKLRFKSFNIHSNRLTHSRKIM